MLKLFIYAMFLLFLTACAGQKQTVCLKVRKFSDVKIQYLEKKTTVVIQDSTGQLIIISNTAISE